MKRDELTRRLFLSKTLSVTAAVPFLALVGPGCKDEAPAEAPKEGGGGEAAPAEPAGPTCDAAALPDAEKTKRDALGYIDKTTIPEKNCLNCLQYMEDNGAGCPGCKLFAGPVTAEGYCNSWVAKPA